MKPIRIVAIVEGVGETKAVPVLIRRFAELGGFSGEVEVREVLRQPASKLLRPDELERFVELAARKLQGPGGILVLLDCDDACPAALGPALHARVRAARSDIPSSVVLARREFEAWFLGAAVSIAGKRGLRADLGSHSAPESVRGCKEWLSDRLPGSRRYSEIADQPALAASFDLELARSSCPSFDKCYREMRSLLERVAAITSCPNPESP